MKRITRGSITIGILAGIGVPLLLAGLGYMASLRNKHEADVKDIKIDLVNKGETISALGANVVNLKEDTSEIKKDIKELLQRIPKK